MKFALADLVFLVIGLKFGWGLSKAILYTAPVVLALIVAMGWGVGVVVAMSGMIGWLQPNLVVKWVLGFALAAYVAPNYGLLDESSILFEAQVRHQTLSFLPLAAYIITEFATRSMRMPHRSVVVELYFPHRSSIFDMIFSAHGMLAATSLSVRGLPCGPPNKSSAVCMFRLARIAAIVPFKTEFCFCQEGFALDSCAGGLLFDDALALNSNPPEPTSWSSE